MAERLRIDRVQMDTGTGTIDLTWAVAQELQARLLRYETTAALVDRMQDAGTSRPVEVKPEDSGPLLVVVAEWAKEVGLERLPAGIAELLDALGARAAN